MERSIPVAGGTISLPTYTVTEPPDIEAIGPIIDEAICKSFGQSEEHVIALRGVSLIDHPGPHSRLVGRGDHRDRHGSLRPGAHWPDR
jgi:hypothetical protein